MEIESRDLLACPNKGHAAGTPREAVGSEGIGSVLRICINKVKRLEKTMITLKIK